MSPAPVELVTALLRGATDPAVVRDLVAPAATYVSLSYDDPDIRRVMPWAGTHQGAESILKTFVDVNRCWEILAFDIDEAFGEGDRVAIFARCTFRSRVLGKKYTSPITVLGKVADGRSSTSSSWRIPSARPRLSAAQAAGRFGRMRTGTKFGSN